MIQLQASQESETIRAHRSSEWYSGDNSLKSSDRQDNDMLEPPRDRSSAGGHAISGEESNSAGLQDPDAETHRSMGSLCSRMTIGRFVETKFIPEHVAVKRSSGRLFYRAMLKHVLTPEEVDRLFRANPGKQFRKLKAIPEWPYLSNVRFCDIGPEHIHRLVSAALARGYSFQTAKHIRNVTSAIFSHAIQERYFVGDNPASLVKPPEHLRKRVVELTPAQAIEALSIMQYPEREMTLIGLFARMSPAEIIGLQWGQVNLADEELNENGVRIPPRTICVRKRWYRGKWESVQGSRARDLSITPPLMRILQRLKRRSQFTGPEDCILTSSVGTPINQNNISNRRVKPIARQLGVPSLTWQAFRNAHDVLASELGKELGFAASAMPVRIAT